MIYIETNRHYVGQVRTNRRVKWQYSDYCGVWETPQRALEKIKEFYPNEKAEYRIRDMFDDDAIIEQGWINE